MVRNKSNFEELNLLFAFIAIVGLVIFLGVLTKGFGDMYEILAADYSNYELIDGEKFEITALKDNSNMEGDFFLGTGNLEEEMYYFFMKKNQDGSISMEKVEVDDAKIFYLEDETMQPYIQTKSKKYLDPQLEGLVAEGEEYHIYVPKSAITEEFKVDME